MGGPTARPSRPALPGLHAEVRASGPRLGGSNDGERGVPDRRHRDHQSQRMPAPMVRAMDASIATAQVKRARFAFTYDSFESVWLHRGPGNRAVFRGRSLALRPRLTTGLPWTKVPMEVVGLGPNAREPGRTHDSPRGTT